MGLLIKHGGSSSFAYLKLLAPLFFCYNYCKLFGCHKTDPYICIVVFGENNKN